MRQMLRSTVALSGLLSLLADGDAALACGMDLELRSTEFDADDAPDLQPDVRGVPKRSTTRRTRAKRIRTGARSTGARRCSPRSAQPDRGEAFSLVVQRGASHLALHGVVGAMLGPPEACRATIKR